MAEDSDLERTEPASDRKLQEARQRGNIPRSRELATFAVLVGSGAVVAFSGAFIYEQLRRMLTNTLSFGHADVADTGLMLTTLGEAGHDAMLALMPIMLVAIVAGIAANLMISGWNLTFEALQPKFDKINPFPGIKRMFSTHALAELVKAVLKSGVIAGAAIWMIWLQRYDILSLSSEAFESAMPHFGEIVLYTYLAAAAAYALVAAIDVPFQLWEYARNMRMTKEEVRRESKDTDGDTQLKARIRSLQREQARRRMMAAVPQADVVVTNPLHFAVALKYEDRRMAAPQVVAKGSQLVAERIKEIAREHRVPIVEAPPLARALHRHVEVGDTIPATLFTAVAQVLAYVYQLNNQLDPALPEDWQVPAELDPGAPA